MFRLDSNLNGVIRQAERLRERIPQAMARALHPDHWRTEARTLAFNTLNALAQAGEAAYVGQFVATLEAAVLGGSGLSLTMRSPFPAAATVAAAQQARSLLDPAHGFSSLFLGPVQEMEAFILEWVATQKDKDQRDAGKSDQEIADFISYVLLSPGGVNVIVSSGKNQGRFARETLMPHLEEFVRQQQQGRLAPETVALWLRAVLAAWRQLIKQKYPALVYAELRAMKGEL